MATRASALLLAAAAAGAVNAAPALAPISSSVARALRLRRRIDAPGEVLLTFDDGPHAKGTEAVLEALSLEGAPATFFLVGEQVRRNPALAREILAAGHRVELHGERHRNQLRLTPGQIRADLERGAASIAEQTGVMPRYYRPPYGIFSAAGLAILRRSPFAALLWSRWGRDWRADASPDSIVRLVSRGLGGGDVVLLHDADTYSATGSWRATAAAVPRLLEEIGERGLRPAALA